MSVINLVNRLSLNQINFAISFISVCKVSVCIKEISIPIKKNCDVGLLSKRYIQIDEFNSYSAEIDFSRQNLTSVDVRF